MGGIDDGFAAARVALDALPKATSALLIHHGSTVFEHYTAAGAPDLQNDTRSATKTITGLAAAIALGDGVIALATPVLPFFADLEPIAADDPLKRGMSFEDLLTMSSPLACDDGDQESPGNEDRMHEHDEWARFIVDLPVTAGAVRDAGGRYPFIYCTVNAVLAGLTIGRAEGGAFDSFVDARLLTPLGITARTWQRSPSGEPMPGGGLRLTTRDLGKLGRLMLDRGQWNGAQIVPAVWIDAMMTRHRKGGPPGWGYGYFIWSGPMKTACGETHAWFMAGNGGNVVMIARDLDAVVVLTRTAYNEMNTAQSSLGFIETELLAKLPCG